MGQEHDASECRGWRAAADLLLTPGAVECPVALIGAPQSEKSLTPGRCDLAPKVLRETLRRFSVYDMESETDLSAMPVADYGDLALKTLTPEQSFPLVVEAVRRVVDAHRLVILAGGNNAITRPGAHGLGADLSKVGLVTLDAHFDLRDLDCGLTNGNPLRALLEDGLPGENIVQIGLAPFANTKRMHEAAKAAGIGVHTITDCFETGAATLLKRALVRLSVRCEAIYVDFDIDVIDRAQCLGAPGARPGGLPVRDFFAAARAAGAHPKVRAVDLTEHDPSLDVGEVTALTAGRWFCEILAGFAQRR
ncbi:MAG: agmatinase [Amphiplicatus sp.]